MNILYVHKTDPCYFFYVIRRLIHERYNLFYTQKRLVDDDSLDNSTFDKKVDRVKKTRIFIRTGL